MIYRPLGNHRHIDEIVAKSKGLIFAVHRCTKLKWGLSSEVLRTLWRQAFEPILLYGCPIWYPALRNKVLLTKLHQVQSLIARKVIRAYKTVSFDASTVLADIIPIELVANKRATFSAIKHFELISSNMANTCVTRLSHSECLMNLNNIKITLNIK